MKRSAVNVCALASVLALSTSAGSAEEIFGKFRLSFVLSNYAPSDSLRTNADNVAVFENEFGSLTAVDDPRPDNAVKNEAEIKDNFRYDLQAAYGLAKWKWGELTLDTSIGFFRTDVGDLEVAGQFDRSVEQGLPIARGFHLFYIPIGTLEEIPVQIGGTVRFRPRSKGLHPYLGAGVGYIYADIEESKEFRQFSENVGNSVGFRFRRLEGGASTPGPIQRFDPATVEAPDTFEYHLSGGLEFNYKKGLSFLVYSSYIWADKEIEIKADDSATFGRAVPNGETDDIPPGIGYPVSVESGGFIDYGSGTPILQDNGRYKVGRKDGVADVGEYFVQGGELKYSGFQFGIGMRYTF